jgi:hypothetical protein
MGPSGGGGLVDDPRVLPPCCWSAFQFGDAETDDGEPPRSSILDFRSILSGSGGGEFLPLLLLLLPPRCLRDSINSSRGDDRDPIRSARRAPGRRAGGGGGGDDLRRRGGGDKDERLLRGLSSPAGSQKSPAVGRPPRGLDGRLLS